MTAQQKAALMRQVAQYARANGISRPTTKEGMAALIAQFAAAQAAQQAGVTHAYWDEIPDAHETHLVDDGATVQIADRVPQGPFIDDFDQMLKDRAAASIGPNGERLDDFDTEFQMIGRQQSELSRVAPWTRTQPPSVVGAILGGQKEVSPGQDPVTVAYWDGADEETAPVTVLFSYVGQVTADPNIAGRKAIRPYGVVQFGTRGFLARAEVDIGEGCQFTVPASSVILQVGLDDDTAGVVSPTVALTGMLSFKATQKFSPITRTRYFSIGAGAGNGDSFQVPPFAKNVTLWRSDLGSSSGAVTEAVRLEFYDCNLALVYAYNIAANAYMLEPIPLSPDVVSVAVVDVTGATGIHGRLIFGLGF